MSDLLASDLRSPNAHSPNESASLTEWLDYMQQIHVSAIDMGLSRVLPETTDPRNLGSTGNGAIILKRSSMKTGGSC